MCVQPKVQKICLTDAYPNLRFLEGPYSNEPKLDTLNEFFEISKYYPTLSVFDIAKNFYWKMYFKCIKGAIVYYFELIWCLYIMSINQPVFTFEQEPKMYFVIQDSDPKQHEKYRCSHHGSTSSFISWRSVAGEILLLKSCQWPNFHLGVAQSCRKVSKSCRILICTLPQTRVHWLPIPERQRNLIKSQIPRNIIWLLKPKFLVGWKNDPF